MTPVYPKIRSNVRGGDKKMLVRAVEERMAATHRPTT
jgi:hypothetical protein